MSKLKRFLDKWFDGLGFIAISRITGVEFYNLEKLDDYMNAAYAKWNSMKLIEKIKMYNEIGFKDHTKFNEREFLITLSLP